VFFQELHELLMAGSAAIAGGGVAAKVLEAADVARLQGLDHLSFRHLEAMAQDAISAALAGVVESVHVATDSWASSKPGILRPVLNNHTNPLLLCQVFLMLKTTRQK
jgi:hypothetical protein